MTLISISHWGLFEFWSLESVRKRRAAKYGNPELDGMPWAEPSYDSRYIEADQKAELDSLKESATSKISATV